MASEATRKAKYMGNTPDVVNLVLLQAKTIVAVWPLNQQLDVRSNAGNIGSEYADVKHILFLKLLKELLGLFFGQGAHLSV
jgi:hypothetical protein